MNVIARNETKYELADEVAHRLRRIILRHLPIFEFRKGRPSTQVTTVYFDTDRFDLFKRASLSYDENLKIRVREYSYTQNGRQLEVLPYCFVEIKQRNQGAVFKRRLRIPKRLLNRLLAWEEIWRELISTNPELNTVHNRDVYRELRGFLNANRIYPRSAVEYRREAHQLNESELRITFDDEVTIFPPKEGLYDVAETLSFRGSNGYCRKLDNVIMEIKSQGNQPDWLDSALRSFLPRNISKFTESIRLLRVKSGD